MRLLLALLLPLFLTSCASKKHLTYTFRELSEYGAVRYLDGWFDGMTYERNSEKEPEIKKKHYNP